MFRIYISVIFLSLFIGVGLNAQQTVSQGAITGVVEDSNGAAVRGAEVSATNLLSSSTIKTTSDQDGRFTFLGLSDGDYRIVVSATGFAESVKQVRVANNEQSIEFQLPISTLDATVTVESETARVDLERVPGGTGLLGRREIRQTLATNLKDVLNFTPGVLAQPRYGSDETQLSVRGSGLRNNYHSRGINVLINGLPYGDADGFSDFESLEFLTASRVELWKGANALRYGGNSAGGALNLVTETGETAFPLEIRVQGGSYGAFKGYLSTGGARGRLGYFLAVSETELSGYREHSHQGRRRLFGNVTFEYDENTDLYADFVFANFAEKLPGSLTYAEYKADPRAANPENVLFDWGRFVTYTRGVFGVKHRFGSRHEVSFNASMQYRNLVHPIFQVLDQDTRTFSGEARYTYTGTRNRFVAGFAPQVTYNGERRFVNNFGVKGQLSNHFDSLARNYGFYFEDQLDFGSRITVVAGGRVDLANRRFTDFFLTNGDQSDKRDYRVFSPKFGFVYRVQENAQIFANYSRSYEPPILGELTSYGAPGFLPLKPQDSWQLEIGTRGDMANKRLVYEIAFYNLQISNEVINQNVQPFPGAPFTIPSFRNASKTRHTGVEVSADAILAKDLFVENGRLSWRTAYTLADFKFRNDGTNTGNFIPGQPNHLIRSEVLYRHPKGFWVSPNVDWSPTTYFVNSENTFRNDSYAVINLKGGYDRKRFGIFVEANNLAGRIYSASTQVDNAAGRFFEPGNGRSAYIGFTYHLGR